MSIVYRPLGPGDLVHVLWGLYEAVSWDPVREFPRSELAIEHPELARYHRDWGRSGDTGVVAERDGVVVGVAFFRSFTGPITGTASSTRRPRSSPSRWPSRSGARVSGRPC